MTVPFPTEAPPTTDDPVVVGPPTPGRRIGRASVARPIRRTDDQLDGTEGRTRSDALEEDSQLVLADGPRALTVMAYLSQTTAEAAIVHLMLTSGTLEPVDLREVTVRLHHGGTVIDGPALPEQQLDLGESFEADLALPLPSGGLLAGESQLGIRLGAADEIYLTV
ncbi:hypothetical protein JSY14_03965 [Brachybacterium sp. EF45031]|uniref:hypothetical protein n=1 Tax=Brachybacterium sillae TaxID=2810536 RepID=UPI00217D964B|nr:hypothetical protein [Brachybacterium sillae]MCS6711212.1 hypothetical protein [Brachybacterium sillae]